MRVLVWLVALVVVSSSVAEGGETHSGIQRQLDVSVPRLDEEITVDGVLNEAVWERAALLTEFSQYSPADGRPADERTEVLVWYSSGAIHFGIRAHADPGAVRASLANRDRIEADDGMVTGLYERQLAVERNRFRNDWLFSYLPTPGTVLFAGYGSTVSEPHSLRFNDFRREADGFFLKFSYLFRL